MKIISLNHFETKIHTFTLPYYYLPPPRYFNADFAKGLLVGSKKVKFIIKTRPLRGRKFSTRYAPF